MSAPPVCTDVSYSKKTLEHAPAAPETRYSMLGVGAAASTIVTVKPFGILTRLRFTILVTKVVAKVTDTMSALDRSAGAVATSGGSGPRPGNCWLIPLASPTGSVIWGFGAPAQDGTAAT